MFYNSSTIPKQVGTINIQGQIYDFEQAKVMGILNITPDSFYDGGRFDSLDAAIKRVAEMLDEGADIIDIGASSTRPGSTMSTDEEELYRLGKIMPELRKHFPKAIFSIDTVYSTVAEKMVLEYGIHMVNDISAGEMDNNMFNTIARLQIPYIMMHMKGTPADMQSNTNYNNMLLDIFKYFSSKLEVLRNLGVNDIIIDPGFGFGKTIDRNFDLLDRINDFKIFELPLMAGLSRKSMIYKTLGVTPEESLNGTTALHMVALLEGADILRVHDVKEAKECVALYNSLVHK